MSRIGPVAVETRLDDFGMPMCSRCLTTVILYRFERGVPVWRHIERKPPCLFDSSGKPQP